MQKWHPDKQKDDGDSATSRFQEINEAYQGFGGLKRRVEVMHGRDSS